MAFLSDKDREFLKQRFDTEMDHTVRILLFTEVASGLYVPGMRQCESCEDTEALLTEVADISERLELEVYNVKEHPDLVDEWRITATPTIAVCRQEDSGVRFMGLPSGYEFTSFLETVISAGSDTYGLTQASKDRLENLEIDLEIKTFSTPT